MLNGHDLGFTVSMGVASFPHTAYRPQPGRAAGPGRQRPGRGAAPGRQSCDAGEHSFRAEAVKAWARGRDLRASDVAGQRSL